MRRWSDGSSDGEQQQQQQQQHQRDARGSQEQAAVGAAPEAASSDPDGGSNSMEDAAGVEMQIWNLLGQVRDQKSCASFAAGGRVGQEVLSCPEIEVHGLGPLGLPLSADAAAALQRHCNHLLDGDQQSLRSPDQFSVAATRGWLTALSEIMGDTERCLGIQGLQVAAQLERLLVYTPGCFAAARHGRQGAAAAAGIIGTLVVLLPSRYKGGEVVVRHQQGQELTFGPGQLGCGLAWAAFWADCEYEVKPVSQGCRLCLEYGLRCIAAPGSSKASSSSLTQSPAAAPAGVNQLLVQLVAAAEHWEDEAESGEAASPQQLIYMLDNRYASPDISSSTSSSTTSSSVLSNLLGPDRLRAQLLQQVSLQTGLGVALAKVVLLTKTDKNGSICPSDHGQQFGLRGWQPLLPGPAAINPGYMKISHEDLWVEAELFDGFNPDGQQHEGTDEDNRVTTRWYYHAALVLWPRHNTYNLIRRGIRGLDCVVNLLDISTHEALQDQQQQQQQQQDHQQQHQRDDQQQQQGMHNGLNDELRQQLKLLQELLLLNNKRFHDTETSTAALSRVLRRLLQLGMEQDALQLLLAGGMKQLVTGCIISDIKDDAQPAGSGSSSRAASPPCLPPSQQQLQQVLELLLDDFALAVGWERLQGALVAAVSTLAQHAKAVEASTSHAGYQQLKLFSDSCAAKISFYGLFRLTRLEPAPPTTANESSSMTAATATAAAAAVAAAAAEAGTSSSPATTSTSSCRDAAVPSMAQQVEQVQAQRGMFAAAQAAGATLAAEALISMASGGVRVSAQEVCSGFQVLLLLKLNEQLASFADKLTSNPSHISTSHLAAAVSAIGHWLGSAAECSRCSPFMQLAAAAVEALQQEMKRSKPPCQQSEQNFTLKAELDCDCYLCVSLGQFLADGQKLTCNFMLNDPGALEHIGYQLQRSNMQQFVILNQQAARPAPAPAPAPALKPSTIAAAAQGAAASGCTAISRPAFKVTVRKKDPTEARSNIRYTKAAKLLAALQELGLAQQQSRTEGAAATAAADAAAAAAAAAAAMKGAAGGAASGRAAFDKPLHRPQKQQRRTEL